MDPATVVVALLAAAALGTAVATTPVPRPSRLLQARRVVFALGAALVASLAPRPKATAAVPPPPTRFEAGTPRWRTPTPEPEVHVVAPGDTLWDITAARLAERLGRKPSSAEIARAWPRLYAANLETIGDDPNLIRPGQRLTIPESMP